MPVDPRLDNPGGSSDSGPFQDPDATEPPDHTPETEPDGVPPETGDAQTEEFDPGVQ